LKKKIFILFFVIIFEICNSKSQPLFVSASYRPYIHSFSNSGDFGLKNIDFNISKCINEVYFISLTYCNGNFIENTPNYTYTLKSNTFKVAIGKYNNIISGKRKHFYGWLAGVNISPTNYHLKFTLWDPMGTVYAEDYDKYKLNLGFEGGYFFSYNIIGKLYLKGNISGTLTPNFSNPFDNDHIKGFTKLNDFSPAGDIFPFFNILVSLGIAVRIN